MKLKRILAMILVLTMAISLGVSSVAFAEGENEEGDSSPDENAADSMPAEGGFALGAEAESVAQAIWDGEKTTLVFYYGPMVTDTVTAGGETYTATQVWSGETVTASNPSSPSWKLKVRDTLTTVVFDESFQAVQPTSTSSWFNECQHLTTLKGIGHFDTSQVTNMSYMFASCSGLTTLDLSSLNSANVTNMAGMFINCRGLTSLDLSRFNTANVTDMSWMFARCSSLTALDLSSFNTANVKHMQCMFRECGSLTSLDVSNFNTSSVEEMGLMFCMCSSLTSLDLSGFDTANVTDMEFLLSNCSSLNELKVSANFGTNVVVTATDDYAKFPSDLWKLSGGAQDAELYVTNDTVPFDVNEARTYVRCFKVSFDKNHESATGEMSDRAIALTGEALPANTFTRPYYRFTGWNTEPDGTGTSCADQGIFAPGANTTLYAQWEAKAKIVEEDPLDPDYAKLTLDGNGGTLSGTKTYWALKGVEIRADDLGPTSAERTNYTFKGWAGSSDGADPLPQVFDADATLYAQWKKNIVEEDPLDPDYAKLTLDGNGGTLSGTKTYWALKGVEIRADDLGPTSAERTNYTFKGWAGSSDGADPLPQVFDADATLYAQWKKNIVEEDPLDPDYVKLTLDGNGGTLSGTKTYWALKGVEIRADDLGPTSAERTNYTFKGWAGSSDGADPLPQVFDADATLYAQWEENPSYTITFSLNGGTLNGKTGTVTYQCYEGTVITLPMPTRTGYTFDYWKGSRYNAGDSYTVNGAHTFTAQWKSSSASPKTGDNSHFGLWITLMGVSCFGLIGGSVLYKKKSRA